MRALCLAIAVLAGCTDLPEFGDGECGNGVIDVDEDCDNTLGKCDQCRVTCAAGTDDECSGIPGGGYLCGADHICHAPSGVFRKKVKPSFPFLVGQGAIADLDGDRIGDAIGFSDITIDVRFGDLAADMTTRSTTLLPYSNTTIALRELDPVTKQVDILVPTPDGITAYTATDKQLVSFPFSGAAGGPTMNCLSAGGYDPVATFEVDKRRFAFIARQDTTGAARIGVLDVVTTECTVADLCGMTIPDAMSLDGVLNQDHYEPPSATPSSVIAVGLADQTTQRVCALRFNGVAGSFSLTTLTPTPLTASPGTFALARTLPAAVCPALVVASSGGLDMYTAGGTASTCTLAPGATAMPGFTAGTGATPSGRIPLVPAIANRGPDALVVLTGNGFLTASDIYALSGTTSFFMYHSPRGLYPIRSGDLDGDGRVEAVASGRGNGGPAGQPDIDVLYRTVPPIDSFIPYRITTQNVPTHISLGDFDGNGLIDIAYTERVGKGELLMLAYGTRDRPLPAVPVTAFNNVLTLARIDMPDSIEPSGQVLDDLLVADQVTMFGPPDLTVLHGNPQRSMLAYFDPRPLNDRSGSFVIAVPGNFDSVPPADVALFEITAMDKVKLWLGYGRPGSQQLIGDIDGTGTDTPLGGRQCSGSAPLCLIGSRFLPWSIGDRDVVIGVAPPPALALATLDPISGDAQRANVTFDVDPQSFVFTMWRSDIDGDSAPNLLLSIGGIHGFGPEPMKNKVYDCSVNAQGAVMACADLVTRIPALSGSKCQYAEPAFATARGRRDPVPTSSAPDILLLCNNGDDATVYRIHAGDLTHPEPVLEHVGFEFLSIGDVNGDRLDDVAGIRFDETLTPIVETHLQCDARDIACQNEGP